MKFYLGTHVHKWLWDERFRNVPLFIANGSLYKRKSPFPYKAIAPWALDSGGFSEIRNHGTWTISPEKYVGHVERYIDELGNLDWAAQQDWMCEPMMLKKTGLTVLEHQQRTVDNFLLLREMAPHLPIAPVLQGWEASEYETCVRLFETAGVDLAAEPVVGVGSVCRRQGSNEIASLFEDLSAHGLKMHGFGVKTVGVARYAPLLYSADSMAWSYGARYSPRLPGCVGHKNCANCWIYALAWRLNVLLQHPELEAQ